MNLKLWSRSRQKVRVVVPGTVKFSRFKLPKRRWRGERGGLTSPDGFQWRSAQEEAVQRFRAGSRFVEVGNFLGRSLCSLGEVVQGRKAHHVDRRRHLSPRLRFLQISRSSGCTSMLVTTTIVFWPILRRGCQRSKLMAGYLVTTTTTSSGPRSCRQLTSYYRAHSSGQPVNGAGLLNKQFNPGLPGDVAQQRYSRRCASMDPSASDTRSLFPHCSFHKF